MTPTNNISLEGEFNDEQNSLLILEKYFDFGLYEQFSRNDSGKKFQNINILYIDLKRVIWRFQIYNYVCEISKFLDFMNTLRNFAKAVFAHISAKFKYFAKQFILTESPDHVL